MTRFCKQRDDYSCGPIALLNIDKFFGRRVTYKDLPRYRKRVRCEKKIGGTATRYISKVLGRAGRKTWPAAKRFLKNGCIAVQTKRVGHFYLMVTNGHGDIGIVNYCNGPCALHVSVQRASQMLRHAYRTWYVSETPTKRKP